MIEWSFVISIHAFITLSINYRNDNNAVIALITNTLFVCVIHMDGYLRRHSLQVASAASNHTPHCNTAIEVISQQSLSCSSR